MVNDYIQSLRDRVQELQRQKAAIIGRSDGIPPFGKWWYQISSAFGSVYVPADEGEAERVLNNQINELEEWIRENDSD